MKIKILGPGCPNCQKMEEMASKAIEELNIEAKIEHIRDLKEIAKLAGINPNDWISAWNPRCVRADSKR